VPDLAGFAANDLLGNSDAKGREAIGDDHAAKRERPLNF
jgi:hypothetical protein